MKSFLLVAFLGFAFLNVDAQRAGTLDSSFGNQGILISSEPNGTNYPFATSVLEDNKILLLSSISTKKEASINLSRFLPDGLPDESFGDKGRKRIDFPSTPFCMTIQSDDKILVGGGGNFASLTLARYKPDGSPDSGFGTNGIYQEKSVYGQYAYDIVRQNDGKSVICGTYLFDGDRGITYSLVARYNENGTPDETFGKNGQQILDTSFFLPTSLAVTPSGKIICAGYNQGFSALIAYNPNGSLDESFGSNGEVKTRFSVEGDKFEDITLQPDGKILAMGTARLDELPFIAVARYAADGKPDESFGEEGKVSLFFRDRSKGGSVALQDNSKIVIAGFAALNDSYFDICIGRLLIDGSLDSSFGTKGKTVTQLETAGEETYEVGLQSNGKIIVSSLSSIQNKPISLLARYYGDPVKQLGPLAKKIIRWIRNHTLNWQYNNADVDYFIIEQSSNSVNEFKEIAKVKTQNSKVKSEEQVYSYNLNAAANSRNYYRITAVSTNGSKVVSTVISYDDVISITVSPNPVKDVLKISGLPVNQKATISIINKNGNILQSAICNSSICNMNVSQLHSGLYNVQVNVNGKLQSVKFVKE